MDYGAYVCDLNSRLNKIREEGRKAFEFTKGLSTSFLVVANCHWFAPTIARKLWNSYNDKQIHKYLPINEKNSKSKGTVLGTMGGIMSWTLQYGALVYAAKSGDSNYHLLPLATYFLSVVYETKRYLKNKKAEKLEKIVTE